MSDATNSNKRDLWLYDDGSWREGFRDDGKVSPLLHFIARPAADDEAREERLKELRDWLMGANADLAYIDKAVTAAGYRFSTTEAQPEHVVEVAMFLASLKRDRDEWWARAERAEAATREADARANTATVAAELMRARAEKAEAALAAAVHAERQRIAKHLRHLGLGGPATQVERCPQCYDLGVVGAGDEPCTAVACDAHAAKVREDAARRAKA